jgi:hypothetical protein
MVRNFQIKITIDFENKFHDVHRIQFENLKMFIALI